MVIGLKRGDVELADHDPEWETLAMQMIGRLWGIALNSGFSAKSCLM